MGRVPKNKRTGYAPSGTRIAGLEQRAKEQHLSFTLAVVEGIQNSTQEGMSLTHIASNVGMSIDTLSRLLHERRRVSAVDHVLDIAEVLGLDAITSLNQYFFEDAHRDMAEQFYISFNEAFVDANEEERKQAFEITNRFLRMAPQDRALFKGMLDAFEERAQQETTPPQESGLPDTPSEE